MQGAGGSSRRRGDPRRACCRLMRVGRRGRCQLDNAAERRQAEETRLGPQEPTGSCTSTVCSQPQVAHRKGRAHNDPEQQTGSSASHPPIQAITPRPARSLDETEDEGITEPVTP